MIAECMQKQMEGGSLIRAMFEDSKKLAEIHGAKHVYDFSLGNPVLSPPEQVRTEMIKILAKEEGAGIHGYMNNAGYEEVRKAIADNLNKRFGTRFHQNNILMTAGAAGGMNVAFKTLVNPREEIVVFAPYFGEYDSYASNVSAKIVTVKCSKPDFLPDVEALRAAITEKTKMVIINSPNNPTGVIYPDYIIADIAEVLREREKHFGKPIFLFSDEPYRELAYDGVKVPYVTRFYDNAIVGYSYSKSFSLAGERIGYLVIPDEVTDQRNVMAAATVANRILGFVNAPSLMQLVVGACVDAEVDISYYAANREMLYDGLDEMGYSCVKPQGAFYLFVKSLIDDDVEFARIAKEYRLVVVPGTAFGCPGYIRLAYCTTPEVIEKALPQFKKLRDYLESRK